MIAPQLPSAQTANEPRWTAEPPASPLPAIGPAIARPHPWAALAERGVDAALAQASVALAHLAAHREARALVALTAIATLRALAVPFAALVVALGLALLPSGSEPVAAAEIEAPAVGVPAIDAPAIEVEANVAAGPAEGIETRAPADPPSAPAGAATRASRNVAHTDAPPRQASRRAARRRAARLRARRVRARAATASRLPLRMRR